MLLPLPPQLALVCARELSLSLSKINKIFQRKKTGDNPSKSSIAKSSDFIGEGGNLKMQDFI